MAEIAESRTKGVVPCLQLFGDWNNYIENFGVPETNEVVEDKSGFDSLTIDKGLTWFKNVDGSPIVLTVKFISKPPSSEPDAILNKVKAAAALWEKHANIKFRWVDDDVESKLRVGFVQGGGHWSYIGRVNEWKPQEVQTMNLDFSDDDDDDEIRGTTLHEFGHAIGCIHEQVNPNITGIFTWNPEPIYAYFKGEPNKWSEQDVDRQYNKFEPRTGPKIQSTEWDRDSIMQYEIKEGWTTPSMEVGRNLELTEFDKNFIGLIYGKPKPKGQKSK